MSAEIRLSDISGAISDLERLAEFYYNHSRTSDQYRQYQSYKRTAQDASAAMSRLEKVWSDFRSYQSSKAVEYDRYVTRDHEPEGCSCHISPPCGFCTRQTDEEEA